MWISVAVGVDVGLAVGVGVKVGGGVVGVFVGDGSFGKEIVSPTTKKTTDRSSSDMPMIKAGIRSRLTFGGRLEGGTLLALLSSSAFRKAAIPDSNAPIAANRAATLLRKSARSFMGCPFLRNWNGGELIFHEIKLS